MVKNDNSLLWHRRLGHVNLELIKRIARKDLVKGLPKINFSEDMFCDACCQGKQTRASFKSKDEISSSRPLQLLHMDLFGPTQTRSLGGKHYVYVVIDFSRFSWVTFLASKDEAFKSFVKLAKRIQREKNDKIISIRSDHGGEFKNKSFMEFCEENGILRPSILHSKNPSTKWRS